MTRSRNSRILALLGGSFFATWDAAAAAPSNGPGAIPPASIATCESQPLRGAGTIYYFCDCEVGAAHGCVAGDDSSAGTSPAAPKRSLASAAYRFNTMDAGDTVALCRGGAWAGSAFVIHNTGCSRTSPCDFRDYAPPWANQSAPRPRIHLEGTDLFDMWVFGHEEGYRFWNLDIRNHSKDKGVAFLMMNDVSDVDICNVSVEGGQIHVQDQGGNAGQARNARIVIRHSQFSRAHWDAILAGSSYMVVDSNYFHDNGTRGTFFDHTVYMQNETIGGVLQDTVGVRITNNESHHDADRPCPGVVFIAHGRQIDLTFENNLVDAAAATQFCVGIDAGYGAGPPQYFRNVAIRRNRVFLQGAGGWGIGVNSSTDAVISDNVIRATGPYTTGINVPNAANNGADVNSGTVIQNNSVYLPHPKTDPGAGIRVRIEGQAHVLENNAVWTNGEGCWTVTRPMLRNADNYCRSRPGPPVASIWVDAPNGNFKPANPGPLIGKASQTSHSPLAIGSVRWSATDAGTGRVPPIDIGAYQR